MNSIFISHSNKDNAEVGKIIAWLKNAGFDSLFIDFDPENGIPPGTKWELEIYRQLVRAQVVMVVCTEHWLNSKWCFAEAVHARMMGKYLIPLECGATTLPALLQDQQAIRFDADRADSYTRLRVALEHCGLNPLTSFAPLTSRSPYPGLLAHDIDDAAVFFGRDEKILEVLEYFNVVWDRRFEPRHPRLILIEGASGTGKSSMARAGILARLRKQPERWRILNPIVPTIGRDEQLDFDVVAQGVDADAPVPVILIDQFEQLLSGPEKWVRSLAARMHTHTVPIVVLATLRSDCLELFRKNSHLNGLPSISVELKPIDARAIREVIRRPAEAYGIKFEHDLIDSLVRDFEGGDSLPLLAFALRNLYDRRDHRSPLTPGLYDGSDGLKGFLEREWTALRAGCSQQELAAMVACCMLMIEVSENGKLIRRAVKRQRIPPDAGRLVERLISARFLTADGSELQLAHERLCEDWRFLKQIADEYRNFLSWLRRLRQARKNWQDFNEQGDAMLPEAALDEALNWSGKHPHLLDEGDQHFIELSAQQREKRRAALMEQQEREAAHARALTLKNQELVQLADALSVQRSEEEMETLWPPAPEKVGAMEEWITHTAAMIDRLPIHEQTLMRLRAGAEASSDSPISQGGPAGLHFSSLIDQWHYDSLIKLVASLKLLRDRSVPDVAIRLSFARRVVTDTIDAHCDVWRETCADIRAHALYGGLALRPQVGLIPLGADPQSGLHEFLHLQSHQGPLPERAADGTLTLHEFSGIVLVLIPGGSFLMGAQKQSEAATNFDPLALPDESPVHQVRLGAFLFSKCQMTQAQWLNTIGDNPSYWSPRRAPHDINLRHPVEQISFEESAAQVRRMGLVLPTEAQWEYGCRAGTGTVFYTGDTVASLERHANLKDRSYQARYSIAVPGQYEESLDSGYAYHAPVGSLLPNAFGLHDMHGNVWEWCRDYFLPYTSGTQGSDAVRVCAGVPPLERICRGGSFAYLAAGARSASRLRNSPNRRDYVLGIRPAMAIADDSV